MIWKEESEIAVVRAGRRKRGRVMAEVVGRRMTVVMVVIGERGAS